MSGHGVRSGPLHEDFVFGYGSLVTGADRCSRDRLPSGYVTDLRGFRRCWGVAMDNTETIPGYKYYVDEHGTRPDVYVAFLDIQPDSSASVNGTCSPAGPEDLKRTDIRERNYRRVEITDSVDDPLGRVWTYVGSAAGRGRLARGKEVGKAVISREYLDRVIAGFRALGVTEYAAFRDSARLDGLPVRDLLRIDLPA